MSRFSLDGRVAVVTGGARGLGRSHALTLARYGAAIVVNDLGVDLGGLDRSAPDAAETVAEEVRRNGGRAIADGSDIADPAGGERLVQAALSAFGRLDILVNNAGILRDRSFHKMSVPDVDAVLGVHLRGAFHVTMPAYKVMREAGYGRIVMTTSASGLFGNFGQANYGAAKAGLLGLTKVLSIEGEPKGILVNAISPVATTRMTAEEFGDKADLFDPALVSELVAFLSSPDCPVSGETFSVGGGQISRIFVGLTKGVFQPGAPLGAAEIGARLDRILDTGDAEIPRSLTDEWTKLLSLHGLGDGS